YHQPVSRLQGHAEFHHQWQDVQPGGRIATLGSVEGNDERGARMRLAGAVVALAALALFGSAPGGARIAPAVNWTRTVVATPEGGFRMGNPNAKVALVEYGSLACPHCRHFEETGYKPLVQQYVRTGRVSYEFRNFLLNAPDISISLLAHCAGPAKFFPMSQVVYATQPQWIDRVVKMTDAQKTEVEGMSDAQRVVRLGE